MKLKQQHLPLAVLSALLWAATNAHAFQMSNLFNGIIVDEIMTSRHLEATEDTTEQGLTHRHIVDSVIITISAWLVFVVVSLLDYIISLFDWDKSRFLTSA